MDAGEELSAVDLTRLINCYQFLLNERVPWMLDKCHRILWRAFLARHEWTNLLTLFRYSSVIWRLRGEETKELSSLQELHSTFHGRDLNEMESNPLVLYFKARLAHSRVPTDGPAAVRPILVKI